METLLLDSELNILPSGSVTPSTPGASTPRRSYSFGPNTPAHLSMSTSTKLSISSIIADLSGLPGHEDLEVDDLALPEELDLSLPISSLLKEGTKRAHVQAENSVGAAALVKGELEVKEYIRWLAVLWRIYSTLELGLAEHSTNPVLAPTYDPSLLSRAPALAQDIAHLLSLILDNELNESSPSPPNLSAQATPLPPFPLPSFLSGVFDRPEAPLQIYLDHIKYLSSSSQTAPSLLAHAYVRYLGDLSGGQYIGAKVKKVYDLSGMDGTRFYHFDFQKGTLHAAEDESKADAKRRLGEVKDWFRKGMDEGVGEDQKLKAHLIKEANLSFALNTHLFSTITAPTQPESQQNQMSLFQQSNVDRNLVLAEQKLGRTLRYFEVREIVEMEKKRAEDANWVPNTWRERGERFFIFGVTVVLGALVSKVILPFVLKYAGPHVGVSV